MIPEEEKTMTNDEKLDPADLDPEDLLPEMLPPLGAPLPA